MRKGKSLERLVEVLENRLNPSDNISIESPKYLTDQTNGTKREHDVLLTIKHGHHSTTISIECKDRKKPVGAPDVDEFSAKCQHTNVNQGVFVSTSGFTKSALVKAKHLGIRCLTLDEVTKLDWLTEGASIVVHGKNFKTASLNYVVTEEPNFPFEEYDLYSPDHQLVTDDMIKLNLKEYSNMLPSGGVGELQEQSLTFRTEEYYLKHRINDEKVGVHALNIDVTYVYEITESRFAQKAYKDKTNGADIAEVAVAEVRLDGRKQQVTIIDDGVTRSMQLRDHDET